jgi:outer membrane protein TolC
MMSNADLEQKYWDWRAALEQVPQEGTPQTTLAINVATNITRGRTALADTVLTAQNMPSMMIPWPGKLSAAARGALENARAAGLRFRQAQFDLRAKVLTAYYNYALTADLLRLEESNAELLSATAMVVEARNRAGSAGQADLLKARNELDLSRNDIRTMRSQLPAQRAAINALLGRAPDAPITVPQTLPASRPVAYTDSGLIALAARQNHSLAALEREVKGKENGVELARLQYFPDFAVGASTDLAGITQSLAGMFSVPLLRHEALDAAIAQAQANLRSSESMLRQARNDLGSRLVTDIASVRDGDRQLELFDHTILPRAEQVVMLVRTAYESGQSTLLDVLDGQRSLTSIRRLTANLRIAREKQLADLEAITADRLDQAPPR